MDEETDLLNNDVESVCNAPKEQIEQNKLKYDTFSSNELELILENLYVTAEDRAASQLLDPEFRALAVPEQISNRRH